MKFETLRLRNFRNYQDLEIEFPSGVVVFFGQNGQGKTNLMEAFHVLLRGQSFRPTQSSTSFLRQDMNERAATALISARIRQNDLVHDLRLDLTTARKSVEWNNNRVTPSNLSRQFPVVLFSPESLSAIKEGPEQRRQLLDDMVMTHSPASQKVIKDFKKALRTRNRLLKDAADGHISQNEAGLILDSLDPSYLPLATELTVARLKALQDIREHFERALKFVLEQPEVDISVDYLVSGHNVLHWSRGDLLSAMHKRAQELRSQELNSGVSLVGPHKHDIRFVFTGKDSRFFCSQGQQRALILSVKMAQILYHYQAYQVYPFLLLDDVLSELDPIRRTNLVKFLKDIPAQIFLTTTDLSFSTDFGDRRLNVFRIEKGMVKTQ